MSKKTERVRKRNMAVIAAAVLLAVSIAVAERTDFIDDINATGTIYGRFFVGDGANLTNIPTTNVSLLYGYNTTNFVPVLTDATGILKLSVRDSQSTNASQLSPSATGQGLTLSGLLSITGNPSNAGNLSLSVNSTLHVNQSTSNVGIGTTGPGAKLHVHRSGTSLPAGFNTDADILIQDTATQNSETYLTMLTGNTGVSGIFFGDTDSDARGRIQYQHNGDFMSFYVGASERVKFDNNGNVGIGTTSPTYKLDVNGVINASGLLVNGSAISSGSTSLPAANITSGTFGSGLFTFGNGLNVTAGGLIVSAGNVGIGTTGPTATLEVNGTIKMIPRTSATCNAAAEGSMFYNITDKHFYGCNSTTWLRIDTTYS